LLYSIWWMVQEELLLRPAVFAGDPLPVPLSITKAGGLNIPWPTHVHFDDVNIVADFKLITAAADKASTPWSATPHVATSCGQPTIASSYLWLALSGRVCKMFGLKSGIAVEVPAFWIWLYRPLEHHQL